MQTIARDADNSLLDLTPLDLSNSVAIRAHAYKPIEPTTPGSKIVLIPYDGLVDQPIPGSDDSVSTSSITIDTVLTVTAPFSIDPNELMPIDIDESSVIMLFPQSQIDLALNSFDPQLSVFVSTPVSATATKFNTIIVPGSKPIGHVFHTSPVPFDLGSTITPNLVDAPLNLVGDFYSVLI